MPRFFLPALGVLAACAAAGARGAADTTLPWQSEALGAELKITLREPSAPQAAGAATPLLFYLKGLAAPRVGTVSDGTLLEEYRAAGFLVAVLDYGGDARARWSRLNRDFVALRTQLHKHQLLAGRRLDAAHIFLVPAGDRLKRDVVFAHDGPRTLALDLLYPAEPRADVGALIEFSCDNQDRMGNYSLQFCTDTMLEGAATEGFAVAMADHPVPAPYKGLDPLPECEARVKAAVQKMREIGPAYWLNGRIVPVGFSRGSGMALLLATTMRANQPAPSDVQGGVILSGRFTYLDLLPNDAMNPRYTAAWGERTSHLERWQSQGALGYLTAPTVPLFLSINATESPDALHQMEVLRARLTQLHSPFEYHPETEPRGHRVPLASDVLEAMLTYLRARLDAPRR